MKSLLLGRSILIILIFLGILSGIYYIVENKAHPQTKINEISNRLKSALNGNGPSIGPIMDFGISDYNESNQSILIFLTRIGEQPDFGKFPVVFINEKDKLSIIKMKNDNKLDKIVIYGYIDEEFDCFVCFGIGDAPVYEIKGIIYN